MYENTIFKVHHGAHPLGEAERPRELTPPYSCGIVYQKDGYKVLRMETGKSRYEYDIQGTLGKTMKRCKTKREAVEIVQELVGR